MKKILSKAAIFAATVKIVILAVAFWACSSNNQMVIPDEVYKDLPFKMDKVEQPKFPNNEVSIVDFGAKSGGVDLNSDAFAKAIDAVVQKGGGKVVVPRGLWLTGPVVLKSNVNLHLEQGAVVLFSPNFDLYPIVETSFEGLDTYRCQSPLSAMNEVNIAVTGKGIIDGSGDAWRPVKKGKMTDRQWKELVNSGGALNAEEDIWYPSEKSLRGAGSMKNASFNVPEGEMGNPKFRESIKDFLRPVLLSIISCKNVWLDGVTFQNSPAWNIHPLMCENLTISNLIVRNPWYSQNGDGLDVESCKNVVVYNSSFDVGDDAICIKSGKDEDGRKRAVPTENLIVDRCLVYHGHGGFVVGSEMSGGVKNIKVSNCTFLGTDVGLRFKSKRGRGGVVEDIWISNINMMNIPAEPLLFDLFYGGMSAIEAKDAGADKDVSTQIFKVDETTPQFRNIFIKDITCNGAGRAMYFNGLPEMNVENVTVDNVTMTSEDGAVISESNGVKLTNINILPKKGAPIEVRRSKNVTLDGKAL
ncbi:MAG: glycoside hydrolase family 28 protein [Prevotellaceae bacterium]|jgi:polygalacturonase|nr:glycoside hydrolase family 28 protein [Prevotellaceae bacterium]